jgi:hypothetical protein
MPTQTEIPATLRKPKALRKLLRAAIAEERTKEKNRDAIKAELKNLQGEAKAATAVRRSLEDELERSCAANDEEW